MIRYGMMGLWGICWVIFSACGKGQQPVEIFNGEDLSGWVNVINSPDTWVVEQGSIVCSGTPTSFLRSESQYENFLLRFEQLGLNGSDSGNIIIHSDALPAPGKPLPRGIRMGGKKNTVAAINGAQMDDSSDARAKEEAVTPPITPGKDWVAYQIESLDGKVTLKINGTTVSEGSGAFPRKGYISLVSDGAEVRFRNIEIEILPSTDPGPNEIAELDQGFVSLYNGKDLAGWDLKPGHINHWTARD